MMFATARQRFLLRQGYTYQVAESFELKGYTDEARDRPFIYSTLREQESLMATLLQDKLSGKVGSISLARLLGRVSHTPRRRNLPRTTMMKRLATQSFGEPPHSRVSHCNLPY